MNPSESVGRIRTNRWIDVTLDHGTDCATGAVIHPIPEFEVADGELCLADIRIERVELGLVDSVVLSEFRVQPL
jgi:hypothetical protein